MKKILYSFIDTYFLTNENPYGRSLLLRWDTYNSFYIILETKINFQNDVTFVPVKLDTKFKVQNS